MSFTYGWHVGNVATTWRGGHDIASSVEAASPCAGTTASNEQRSHGSSHDGYVVFVGWMLPGGGADRAIRIARRAGKRIVLVARVWEFDEREYFLSSIEPLLDADAVYLGDVAGERRLELLRSAEALITPTRWPESLVRIFLEAVAGGTPILALGDGLAADVIEHGKTGFLCHDDDEITRMLVSTPHVVSADRELRPADVPVPAPPRVPWPCHAEPAHGIPLQLPPPGGRFGRDRWRRAAVSAR
ncbi:glycosyltransferase [Phytoactinopolyspora halotolerans]|uniref:Glycosyltransferase family 4 protein n=1 Tax=Phytoactinopolyspora halotolerans TaxID=1981512 RepID=A0A6L9S6G3_9ACTN|nr:glycosyltransferase [Phytoactinopolyspora halotolerans]NEE00607.1 glycosyltransferase family 4 protein [Phytoactinopolyspora halotolerans]